MLELLFSWMAQPEAWLAFVTLLLLEVVLGIDNIIFISILTGKLPVSQRQKGRTVGLLGAMLMRLALLASISWVVSLKAELFQVLGRGFSGKDVVLFTGGLFLIYKAVKEMHEELEGPPEFQGLESRTAHAVTFAAIIVQIMLLDIVFSLDSVITAVGMADDLGVMMWAVVAAVGLMLFAARPIGDFVQAHPTVKMLALAFLLLIGANLTAEGLHFEIPKSYTYFAMGFAILVETLNLRVRKREKQTPARESELLQRQNSRMERG